MAKSSSEKKQEKQFSAIPAGVLTDEDIETFMNELFDAETCDVSCIRHASYELRVGTRVEFLRFKGTKRFFEEWNLNEGQQFHIKPGQTAKIYSWESVSIPHDVVAHAIAIGQIFAVGLSPENTFADPGWHGRLYITVSNFSPNKVRMKVGDPLARLEFHKLRHDVKQAHSGEKGVREPMFTVVPGVNVHKILYYFLLPVTIGLLSYTILRELPATIQDRISGGLVLLVSTVGTFLSDIP